MSKFLLGIALGYVLSDMIDQFLLTTTKVVKEKTSDIAPDQSPPTYQETPSS